MSDEQTTPEHVEEATPAPVVEATPENGNLEADQQEPNSTEATESVTAEQQLAALEKRLADQQAEITRQQQLTSQYEENQRRLQEANAILMGREQERVDPLLAVNRQLAEEYDPERRFQLEQQKTQLLLQQAKNELLPEVLKATQVQDALGGMDPNELNRFDQSLSPAEQIEMRKTYRAIKNGTYDDERAKQRAAAEQEAARAQQLNQLLGDPGSSGAVPGGLNPSAPKTISDVSFYALPQSKRDQVIEAGFTVVDHRGAPVPL